MTTTAPVVRGLGMAARGTWHGIRLGLAEVWWWVSGAARYLVRAPVKAISWTAGTVWSALTESWLVLTGFLTLMVVPALWARCWPDSGPSPRFVDTGWVHAASGSVAVVS